MNRRVTNLLLYPYYYGMCPVRQWCNARRRAAANMPVIVLFYHRVADKHLNAWSISTRRFARQITWLQRHFTLVSLRDAQACMASGCNRRPLVSITFDDGYADNNAFALPLLLRRRVPFTYFVAVQHIQHGEPFAHDGAAGQPHPVNKVDELVELAEKGVEIGLHTRTHADLGRIDDEEELYDEVVRAGQDLARLVHRPIRYFAFPFGLHANLSVKAFRMAREAGYWGVCSAYGGYNFPGDDPFHIQRFHADSEWIRWKNCLAIDPRKTRRAPRHAYQVADAGMGGMGEGELSTEPVGSARSDLAKVTSGGGQTTKWGVDEGE
ncbi:MAG: polysaccharide deacetylase family protein [Planctomycetota bacterium]